MKGKHQYFRVVTSEQDDVADMYLYGFIGQDFWWSEQLREESITDLEFVRKFRELERRCRRINIRINSPGGSVLHGDPIIAAISTSSCEVHTYNDGIAASMAADIWLAGKTRHMSRNAKLMIHATSSYCFGTAKDMRSCADMLDKFDAAAIASMAAVTGMSEEEIRSQYYDYQDHWMTARDCADLGLIDDVEDYVTESMNEDPEKLSYAELLQRFSQNARQEHDANRGWVDRLMDFLRGVKNAQPNTLQSIQPAITPEMNKQELERSLASDEISEDQVIEVLRSRGYNVTKAGDQPQDPGAVETADSLQENENARRLDELSKTLDTLLSRVDSIAKAPAASATTVPAEADPDGEEGDDFLKSFNEKMAAGARQRDRIVVQ